MCLIAVAWQSHPRYPLVLIANRDEFHERPSARRGALVAEFLASPEPACAWAELLGGSASEYAGYNLLLWDGEELIYATNRLKPRWESLPPGLYGLSNAGLDTPWPKLQRARAALARYLDDGQEPALLAAFADETVAADEALPDTGVGLVMERALSPPFIRRPGYGTRCTSLIRLDQQDQLEFLERRHGVDGAPAGDTRLALVLNRQGAEAAI